MKRSLWPLGFFLFLGVTTSAYPQFDKAVDGRINREQPLFAGPYLRFFSHHRTQMYSSPNFKTLEIFLPAKISVRILGWLNKCIIESAYCEDLTQARYVPSLIMLPEFNSFSFNSPIQINIFI